MSIPTPTIPTFTDGMIVHASDLNALAANITNLYTYNQTGFVTQRPCVIAKQTTGQILTSNTDTLINFQSAAINTDSMWTAAAPNQFTIQHAGIYFVFSQTRYPSVPSNALNQGLTASLLANGTSFANAIATMGLIPPSTGSGTGPCFTVINLAAGATLYLNLWQSTGGSLTLGTDGGASYLGAIFLTSST
jgi:hypothetical protein